MMLALAGSKLVAFPGCLLQNPNADCIRKKSLASLADNSSHSSSCVFFLGGVSVKRNNVDIDDLISNNFYSDIHAQNSRVTPEKLTPAFHGSCSYEEKSCPRFAPACHYNLTPGHAHKTKHG